VTDDAGAPDDDLVLYELRDAGVALLTLNRPDRLNARTAALGARYFELLHQCAADPAVRVVVVTGAGKGWCAGADMDALQSLGTPGGPTVDELVGTDLQRQTTEIPKPVIAAINGACAGIGFAQALMCDLRFAAAGAKFTTAFARRGLIAEWGSAWVLPRLVGAARAFDLLMSARTFVAEEALEMGLLNAVYPADELLDRVLAYATDLAVNASPTSLAIIKQQVYADANRPLAAAEDQAIVLMRESLERKDFAEGVASFVERRPPSFAPYADDPAAAR
jgi:enoyl-CoA hydratase/carnithine racemase